MSLSKRFFDKEFGVYNWGGRVYNPVLARGMQPDPTGYPDGMNRYEWLRSNPVTGLDPDGLQTRFDSVDNERIRKSFEPVSPIQRREEFERHLDSLNRGLRKNLEILRLHEEIQTYPDRWSDYEIGMLAFRIAALDANGWGPQAEESYRQKLESLVWLEKHVNKGPEPFSRTRYVLDRMGVWPRPQRAIGQAVAQQFLEKALRYWLIRAGAQRLATAVPFVGWGVTAASAAYYTDEAYRQEEARDRAYAKLVRLYKEHVRLATELGRRFREPEAPPPAATKTNSQIIMEYFEEQENRSAHGQVRSSGWNWNP